MKNLLFVILLMVFMGIACQLLADDVVINSFPHEESFEGITYPPTGWEVRNNAGDPIPQLMTNDQANPTQYDTSDGNNWVRLQTMPGEPTNWATFVSPRIDFPMGNEFYKLTLSLYGTEYGTEFTSSNVRVGRMAELSSPNSIECGVVYNKIQFEPVGWRDYSCSLGHLGGISQYIVISLHCVGEPINIDNIRIEEGTPWNGREPFDNAQNADFQPWFTWSDYATSTNTYSVYTSTDGTNFTLLYQGTSSNGGVPEPLEPATTYYWYVVAVEYGHTIISPLWSFETRISTEPDIEDAIYFYPYLADFQVEDRAWLTFPYDKNAKLGDAKSLKQGLGSQPQEGNTDKSDDYPVWERVLDGTANYAFKLQGGLVSALQTPLFYLTGGQTYQIKYNYRQSVYTEPSEEAGIFLLSQPWILESENPDMNIGITNTNYALRIISVTPEETGYYLFGFLAVSTVDLYVDNFRITQNGDDVLTAAALTVDGVATPDPAPIYNAETQAPLDTNLHIANVPGTPEITATVTWTSPEVGSHNTGLKLNLHSSEGNLAGAIVTFIHNLGYAPASASYRIVPNAFATVYNPNNGSWTSTQCLFTIPASKANGDYEVILLLSEEQTLPMELSSFTAIPTADYFVNLQWTTQTETNLLGFYLYRSTEENLAMSQQVSGLILGTNSSQTSSYQYVDSEVNANNTYYYWLLSVDICGTNCFNGPVMVTIGNSDDMGDTPEIPLQSSLLPVYPNPFNPVATIPYQVKAAETVQISIYNTKGQMVQTYQRNHSAAGTYRIIFEGKDANDCDLASGIYYCVMKAGKSTSTAKMVLLK